MTVEWGGGKGEETYDLYNYGGRASKDVQSELLRGDTRTKNISP